MSDPLRRYLSSFHRALCGLGMLVTLVSIAVVLVVNKLWLDTLGIHAHPVSRWLVQHPKLAPWLVLGLPLLAGLFFLNVLRLHMRNSLKLINEGDSPWSPLYQSVFLFVVANLAIPLWMQFLLLPVTDFAEMLKSYTGPGLSGQPGTTPTPEVTVTSSPSPSPSPEVPLSSPSPYVPPQGTSSGRHVLFLKSGKVEREVDLELPSRPECFTTSGDLMVWNDGLHLTAVSLVDQSSPWRVDLSSPEKLLPSPSGLVLTRNEAGTVLARSTQDGKLLWRQPGMATIVGDQLYRLEVVDGQVRAIGTVERANGELKTGMHPLEKPLLMDEFLVAGVQTLVGNRLEDGKIMLTSYGTEGGKPSHELECEARSRLQDALVTTELSGRTRIRSWPGGEVVTTVERQRVLQCLERSFITQLGNVLTGHDISAPSHDAWRQEGDLIAFPVPDRGFLLVHDRAADTLTFRGKTVWSAPMPDGIEVLGPVGASGDAVVVLVAKP